MTARTQKIYLYNLKVLKLWLFACLFNIESCNLFSGLLLLTCTSMSCKSIKFHLPKHIILTPGFLLVTNGIYLGLQA
jgi:hypothetical protein